MPVVRHSERWALSLTAAGRVRLRTDRRFEVVRFACAHCGGVGATVPAVFGLPALPCCDFGWLPGDLAETT